MSMSKQISDYILAHQAEAFELLTTLAKIPAPSHKEEKRATFCKQWLEDQGAVGVYIDEACNVIYPIGCTDDNPIVIFSAHLDVVFPDETPLPMEIRDGRIYCPGVGDDTAGVAALLLAAKYLTETGLQPVDCGVLLVANSCEEGLGNLKGMRQLFSDFGSRIISLVSFDASNEYIASHCVGSSRYRLTVTTKGGHSYANFGNDNAIVQLAALIVGLNDIKVPTRGKTTFNFGVIEGGTSVNSIAQEASVLYEFRSDNREDLAEMEAHFRAALAFHTTKGVQIHAELLGQRPCMGDVDPTQQQTLIQRAAEAVRTYYQVEPKFKPSSFDGNIPLSMGIPAVAVNCYFGGGTHTREEYVEIDSLLPGLRLVFDLILDHF